MKYIIYADRILPKPVITQQIVYYYTMCDPQNDAKQPNRYNFLIFLLIIFNRWLLTQFRWQI